MLAQAPDPVAAVAQFHELAKVTHLGKKAWPDPDVYEPIKTALAKFRDELKGWDLACFDATADELRAGRRGRPPLAARGREVAAAYRERKKMHGVVDFQDLLTATRDLLRDRPEVRGRLQERYRFLLIDELQDTDPVQMELVESLCGAGLAAGKLFAVGDANQSIYRFRGADVHAFLQLRDKVAAGGAAEPDPELPQPTGHSRLRQRGVRPMPDRLPRAPDGRPASQPRPLRRVPLESARERRRRGEGQRRGGPPIRSGVDRPAHRRPGPRRGGNRRS